MVTVSVMVPGSLMRYVTAMQRSRFSNERITVFTPILIQCSMAFVTVANSDHLLVDDDGAFKWIYLNLFFNRFLQNNRDDLSEFTYREHVFHYSFQSDTTFRS